MSTRGHSLWLAAVAGVALLLLTRATAADEEKATAIIVRGAGGGEEYDRAFAQWAENWRNACAAGAVRTVEIASDATAKDSPRAQLQNVLQAEAKESGEPLWLVLLGHGTFDGREAKFNLQGDDLAASELAEWLQPFSREVIVICGFSASGAWVKPLTAKGRVVITATKSGGENNYARFGKYLSETIGDIAADLDHDGQTSLLEAWLSAARKVADFYQSEGRLATEHSLLEDNGDGLGTPADFFQGVRAVKRGRDGAAADGLRAHQIHLVPNAAERAWPPELRAQRDALERELADLREEKATLPEAEYAAKLEAVLLKLARLYRSVPAAGEAASR